MQHEQQQTYKQTAHCSNFNGNVQTSSSLCNGSALYNKQVQTKSWEMMKPWLGDFWLQIWIAFQQKSSLQSTAGHKLSNCHPPIAYKFTNRLMECSTLWAGQGRAEQSRATKREIAANSNKWDEWIPSPWPGKSPGFFLSIWIWIAHARHKWIQVRPILRGFVGLASLNWVGEWWADCHWSCADYYVILPPPRNYTFLLHLTRGKATVNQHPPVHHACRMDGCMDAWMNDVWTKSTFSLYSCLVTYHGDKLCTNHPLSSTYHVTTKVHAYYLHA